MYWDDFDCEIQCEEYYEELEWGGDGVNYKLDMINSDSLDDEGLPF